MSTDIGLLEGLRELIQEERKRAALFLNPAMKAQESRIANRLETLLVTHAATAELTGRSDRPGLLNEAIRALRGHGCHVSLVADLEAFIAAPNAAMTDRDVDQEIDDVFRKLRASGHNGGMVGVAFNRAVFRAGLAAALAPRGDVPASMVEELAGSLDALADGLKASAVEMLAMVAAAKTDSTITNPHTGTPRDHRDVESDPAGLLIVKSGAEEHLHIGKSADRFPTFEMLTNLAGYFHKVADLWEGPDGAPEHGTDLCVRIRELLLSLAKEPMALGIKAIPAFPTMTTAPLLMAIDLAGEADSISVAAVASRRNDQVKWEICSPEALAAATDQNNTRTRDCMPFTDASVDAIQAKLQEYGYTIPVRVISTALSTIAHHHEN